MKKETVKKKKKKRKKKKRVFLGLAGGLRSLAARSNGNWVEWSSHSVDSCVSVTVILSRTGLIIIAHPR